MVKKINIVLDKERTMAFPLMSILRLKKEHGIELKDLSDKEKAQDVETILAIIWASLIHEDKELTFDDVGYMIDVAELPAISEKITELFKGLNEKNLKK